MSEPLAPALQIYALPGIPTVQANDKPERLIESALDRARLKLQDEDILVIASKIISRAENAFVDLATITPSEQATHLAQKTDKDPRLVELILKESSAISRVGADALIVRHRLGFVCANAGIDSSNVRGAFGGEHDWVLTLPLDPDQSAQRIQKYLEETQRARIAVIITDSHARPFRLGSLGLAIGIAGINPLSDQRGRKDLHGKILEHTIVASADAIAAAADLVAGQANEGTPVCLVRGLTWQDSAGSLQNLLRPVDQDLYA